MHDSPESAWLDAALEQAEKSWNEGGIPIGAVLVDAAADGGRGVFIARGHNERKQRNDPTAHAEVMCLRNAGARRDLSRMTLVSTLSPCVMCSGTAILFRIPRVVLGENESFQGAEELMRASGIALTNLDDARCKAWMQRLMTERRELWEGDIGL